MTDTISIGPFIGLAYHDNDKGPLGGLRILASGAKSFGQTHLANLGGSAAGTVR